MINKSAFLLVRFHLWLVDSKDLGVGEIDNATTALSIARRRDQFM